MDDKRSMKEKGKFTIDELVLCYEPDPMKAKVLYDAKVLDIDLTKDDKGKKVNEYYIHFQGWNKSWDRWILEDKILKDNEASRGMQSKLLKEAIKPKKRKRKITKGENSNGPSEEKEESDKQTPEVEEEIKVIQLPPVSLDIPKVLANKLEDDCYNIKRKKKLIHLPRTPSVATILSDYYEHRKKIIKKPEEKDTSLTIVEELIDGLTTYFNFYLNTLLLYNFEREQYLKFFPLQKPPPHLIALHTATPPVTPLLSPKLSSIVAMEKATTSKESSRSNSRSSSFSEDAPLSLVGEKVVPRPRGRPSRRKSNIEQDSAKRKRTDSGSSKTPLSPMSPVDPPTPLRENSSERPTKRETRSLRQNSLSRSQEVKEEMIKTEIKIEQKESTDEQGSGSASRLRRSTRVPKIINTPPPPSPSAPALKRIIDDSIQPWSLPPKNNEVAKEEPQPDLLKPLTVQTDMPHPPVQPHSKDHSFMMYPIGTDKKTTPMLVYGPEHFLRLFVKLPVLLASSSIEQPKLSVILRNVSKLLDYLSTRLDLFDESVYSESVL